MELTKKMGAIDPNIGAVLDHGNQSLPSSIAQNSTRYVTAMQAIAVIGGHANDFSVVFAGVIASPASALLASVM